MNVHSVGERAGIWNGIEETGPDFFFGILFISVLICLSFFVAHRYIVFSVDRMTKALKIPTDGARAAIVSLGMLNLPISLIVSDRKAGERFSSEIICNSVLGVFMCGTGVSILFGKKQRVSLEITRHAILFLTVINLLWMLLDLRPDYSKAAGSILLCLYFIHLNQIIEMGPINITENEQMRVIRAFSCIKKVGDCFMSATDIEKCPSTLSFFVSPFAMLSALVLSFGRRKSGAYTTICFLSLAVSAFLYAFARKRKTVSSIYTFICASVWMNIFSLCIAKAFFWIVSEEAIEESQIFSGMFFSWKYIFPSFIIILSLLLQKRYKLAMCLCFSLAIHNSLCNHGIYLIMRTGHNLYISMKSKYSVVFLVTSIILLFMNSEIRTGLFEKEVGVLLLCLYILFIICSLYISDDKATTLFPVRET